MVNPPDELVLTACQDGGTSGYSKPVDYYDEERDVSINISKSTWKYLLQDLTIEMETLVQ